MEEILTQDEIDSLLKGMTHKQLDNNEKEKEENIVPFDLTNQEKIIRGRMPTLEIINQRFARIFRTTFSSMLRKVIDVNFLSIETIKFGEYLKSLPIPSSIHLFKIEPLKGYNLFVIESKLVFSIIDIFFGGDGTTTSKIEGRDFTIIEDRLIKKVVLSALKDMQEAWSPVHKVKMEYFRSEMNPQFATIVPHTDVVLLITFEVEIDQVSGTIMVCIPYSTIEPIRAKLYTGFQTERLEVDVGWINRLKKIITTLYVNSSVELGSKEMTVKEILNLKKGDVINLGKDISEPLTVYIEKVPKFKGIAGIYRNNKAIKITELLKK